MYRELTSTVVPVVMLLVLVTACPVLSAEIIPSPDRSAINQIADDTRGESLADRSQAQESQRTEANTERLLKEAQQKAGSACSKEDAQGVVEAYQELMTLLETDAKHQSVADVYLQLGRFNLYAGSYREAERFLARALKLFGVRHDAKGTVEVLCIQVVLNLQKERHDTAAELLEEALRTSGSDGDIERQAACLRYVATISEECNDFVQDSGCSQREIHKIRGKDRQVPPLGFMKSLLRLLRTDGMHEKAEQLGEQSLAIARNTKDDAWEASALEDLAHIYKTRGQYDRAFIRYLKALKIHERLKDGPNQTRLMNSLGRVLLVQGKNGEARSFHAKALQVAQEGGDLKGEAVSLGGLGSVYQAMGEYVKAADCHEKSLAIVRRTGNVRAESYTLDNLGNIYMNKGEYAKAADCYQKSLIIRRKLGHVKGEATSLNNLGVLHQAWGKQNKALAYLEESLNIFRKIGDVRGEASSLNELGEVCRAWRQYDKALDYFEKSLSITQKIGDVKGQATSLNNLGNVYRLWGQFDKALECYEKSLAITKKSGDAKGEATSLNNLGKVYRSWGQYDKALQRYQKSHEITRKIGDIRGEASSLKSMGIVSAALKNYEQAARYYEQALDIEEKLGVSTSVSNALLAQLYMDMGEVQRAETYAYKAKKVIPIGRLLLLKSDFQGAKEVYAKLLKKAEQDQHRSNLFVAHTGLGMAMEGLGDYAGAAEHYSRAIRLTEKERDQLASGERDTYFDVNIRGMSRTAPYEGMARVLVVMNQQARAFKISEQAKARAFAEAIARKPSGLPLDVPPEVQAKSRELADRMAELEVRREKAIRYADNELLEYLQSQISNVESEIRSYRASLKQKFPLYAATRYPARSLPLKESSVRENEWVLSYDATDNGLLIYLVHGKQILRAVLKPVKKKAVEELVRKFRIPLVLEGSDNYQQKMDKLRSFDFAAGRQLADLLIGDVLPDLPAHVPIIIIPDDSLSDLPFEMLVLNEGARIEEKNYIPCTIDAHFFGDRNPVSYYQSVTALTLTRTFGTKKITGNKLLVIADPVTDPYDERVTPETLAHVSSAKETPHLDSTISLLNGNSELLAGRLIQTKALAENLLKINASSEALMGFDASKQRFLKEVAPRLSEFKHIVFATHGSYGSSERGVKEPVLCLTLIPQGTDGLLRMSEVMGLKLNADLVALTACQSGLGKKLPGEGIMGMGRAFQYAGARSVLMSLWSVQATASTKLVETFYRKLMEGNDKLEALTLARNEIRENGYDHPFFWAGLILAGEID